MLFGSFDVEAFHSGLFVFGSEYWYGGKIFRSEPPCIKQFGEPIKASKKLRLQPSEVKPELQVVRLGYTFVTHDEFSSFLCGKIIPRYSGLEHYDLLTHSCNHFSDESAHFLLGHGLPEHVLDLQRRFSSKRLLALRPYLNQYLGGFSCEDGGGDQLLRDDIVCEGPGRLEPEKILGTGVVVILDAGAAGIGDQGERVIATIVEEDGKTCKIKYFDHIEGKVATIAGVPSKAVLKRVDVEES